MDAQCRLPATVDAAWVTGVLEAAGVARGATVVEVRAGGWIGSGQAARNVRVELAWDRPEGRPATLVAKLPSEDQTARDTLFATGSYLKEWLFYDQLAADVGTRVPACHGTQWRPEDEEFVLLMEDVVDAEPGDQLVGLEVDRLSLAIEQAVPLHVCRFADPALEDVFRVPGNPAPSMVDAAPLAQAYYEGSVPGFLDRLGDRLDPDVAGLIADFGPRVASWTVAEGRPRALTHHDFRPDNLLFGTTPEASPVVVVDWQTIGAGLPAADVAYLIGGSVPDPTVRAAVERDLVEEYRSRLHHAGVTLGADEVWDAYRYSSLHALLITVISSVQAERTERGDDMFTAMAQRAGRQILDLDALSLVA